MGLRGSQDLQITQAKRTKAASPGREQWPGAQTEEKRGAPPNSGMWKCAAISCAPADALVSFHTRTNILSNNNQQVVLSDLEDSDTDAARPASNAVSRRTHKNTPTTAHGALIDNTHTPNPTEAEHIHVLGGVASSIPAVHAAQVAPYSASPAYAPNSRASYYATPHTHPSQGCVGPKDLSVRTQYWSMEALHHVALCYLHKCAMQPVIPCIIPTHIRNSQPTRTIPAGPRPMHPAVNHPPHNTSTPI